MSEQPDEFVESGVDPYAVEREAARYLAAAFGKRKRARYVVLALLVVAGCLAALVLAFVLGIAVGVFLYALNLIL